MNEWTSKYYIYMVNATTKDKGTIGLYNNIEQSEKTGNFKKTNTNMVAALIIALIDWNFRKNV